MSDINENREIAIKLSGVKKQYKLGQIGGGTLTADLQSWWARKRGKEDPNTKIGSDQRLIGKTFMALNGIDLTVYKGEALGIIGGNGAGKSTMLKLLSRVTAPTDGEIDIYGRITSMLEVGTGFNGELTGRENVYMNGAILGMTKAEIDAKMEDIIEFSEVREFIDTPVKRYSSGMYVKLAFSVAAHLDSEIMIMDEVLAVGDMAFQKKCLDKMRDAAKKEGRTVLYVSHNMNTIRQLCDRCIVLDQGKIVFKGDVEEGIGRYLGSNVSLNNNITFDNVRSNDYTLDNKVTFCQLVFKGKNLPVYTTTEKIVFSFSIFSKCEIEKFAVRFVVKDISGVIVGMASTKANIILKAGFNELDLEFLHDTLAPGSYTLKIVAYSSDEFGKGPLHDVIDNTANFDIVASSNENNNMQWNSKVWGHLQFATLLHIQ